MKNHDYLFHQKEMETLCYIHEINQAIRAYEACFEQDNGIGFNESMALCVLSDQPLTSGYLAKTLNISFSNVSKILRTLEEKGLVVRQSGKDDRRNMYYSRTAEGRQKTDALICDRARMSQRLCMLINYFEKQSKNKEK